MAEGDDGIINGGFGDGEYGSPIPYWPVKAGSASDTWYYDKRGVIEIYHAGETSIHQYFTVIGDKINIGFARINEDDFYTGDYYASIAVKHGDTVIYLSEQRGYDESPREIDVSAYRGELLEIIFRITYTGGYYGVLMSISEVHNYWTAPPVSYPEIAPLWSKFIG